MRSFLLALALVFVGGPLVGSGLVLLTMAFAQLK